MRPRNLCLYVSLLLLLTITNVFGGDPPVVPGTPPPWAPTGREESDTMPAVFNGPVHHPGITPWSHAYSGPLVAWSFSPRNRVRPSAVVTIPTMMTAQQSRFRTTTQSVPNSIDTWYQRDISGVSGNGESEPSLTAFTNFTTNTTYTTESYQQGDPTHQYTIVVASATDPQSGTFTKSTPYIPTGYTDAFDTTLNSNPYADGVRPGALYLTTCLAYSAGAGQSIGNPTTLRVWGSDNGGATWTTSGQTLDYATSSDTEFIDKPVSTVSKYPADRGSLYVAWVRFPTNQFSQASRILVSRNRNGLFELCRPAGGGCVTSWDATLVVNDGSANDLPATPQVVTNPENGNVYVFWLTKDGALQMRRWIYGSAWSAGTFQPTVTVANILLPTRNSGYLPNGLRASVVPTIKYNFAVHALTAAWHARMINEPLGGTNETGLYYVTFNADAIASPVQPTLVNDAPGSQIQPAIDFDGSGKIMMTYYSTQNFLTSDSVNCSSFQAGCGRYQLFALSVAPGGAITGPTLINGGLDGFSGYANSLIGDYHETFYFTYPTGLGSLWNTSWSTNVGNSGNPGSPAEDAWLTGLK